MPLAELERYQGRADLPVDFRDFWQETLSTARQAGGEVRLTPVTTQLRGIDAWDMTFSGFNGEPIRAWLRIPKGASGPLPAIVTFVGYNGGRGHVLENLLWVSAGYVSIHMDVRGQGASRVGATSDPWPSDPQVPGVMTKGISDPRTHYYRRLLTDAVRAVDAAAGLDCVDSARIATIGGSQGGIQALAAAGLSGRVRTAVAFVPFLCDVRRAVEVTDLGPFGEVSRYLSVYRDQADHVHRVLDYFDGVNFARVSTVPVAMSVGLVDAIVPASTVFAAYNNYAGPKELWVWPHNGHEGGGISDQAKALDFVDHHLR